VSVSEVNGLLERFGQAQKMMRSLRRGGGAGVPGMPAIPGMAGAKKGARGQQRKKGKSGNPAKRAQEERAFADKAAGARVAAVNSAFGMPGAQDGVAPPGQDPVAPGAADPANLELPKGFEKFLGK
jgi:signal recognition particle subunit SRP54